MIGSLSLRRNTEWPNKSLHWIFTPLRSVKTSELKRYEGEMMGIHSKILIHWTGKDIETYPEDERTQLYVKRLKNSLQEGLYTKTTEEDVIRGWKIKNITRLCLTEIRLSQAQMHAERYGKLGLGFSRDFIMNKGGRPVIYIPFEAAADSRLLEDSIRCVHEKSKDNNDIHESSKWIMTHVKRMWNEKGEDFYEEMEWRIVLHANDRNIRNVGNGVHRLKFEPSDIKVIIFPSEDTKRSSLEDDYIRKCLSDHLPMIATLDDCHNF